MVITVSATRSLAPAGRMRRDNTGRRVHCAREHTRVTSYVILPML